MGEREAGSAQTDTAFICALIADAKKRKPALKHRLVSSALL
jgi:hypothetical protein